jgi:hypothetical protein
LWYKRATPRRNHRAPRRDCGPLCGVCRESAALCECTETCGCDEVPRIGVRACEEGRDMRLAGWAKDQRVSWNTKARARVVDATEKRRRGRCD